MFIYTPVYAVLNAKCKYKFLWSSGQFILSYLMTNSFIAKQYENIPA